MGYWSVSRVTKAGASATLGNLYVQLADENGRHDTYFALAPAQGNQLLATALTALSLDLTVDAFVGEQGDPVDSVGNFYCSVLYVRR